MKIALINEFSQASKNEIILSTLKKVVEPLGHTVYNTGMQQIDNPNDLPSDYTPENPRLTYLHIGIQAALLLNSKAVDFVVTGCGTGQGALMSFVATASSRRMPICSFRSMTVTLFRFRMQRALAGVLKSISRTSLRGLSALRRAWDILRIARNRRTAMSSFWTM